MKLTELLLDMINSFKQTNLEPNKITLGHYEFKQLEKENKGLMVANNDLPERNSFCGVEIVESSHDHEISIK